MLTDAAAHPDLLFWTNDMRDLIRSTFFWRFLGGFALGAVGVVALHPGAVAHNLHPHAAPTEVVSG